MRDTLKRVKGGKRFHFKVLGLHDDKVKFSLCLSMNDTIFRYAWIPDGMESVQRKMVREVTAGRRLSERVQPVVSGRGRGVKRRASEGMRPPRPSLGVSLALNKGSAKPSDATIWTQVKELEEVC